MNAFRISLIRVVYFEYEFFSEVTKFKDSSLVYEEWSGGRAASVELLISVISEVAACTQVSVSQSPVDDNTKHHRPLPLTSHTYYWPYPPHTPGPTS